METPPLTEWDARECDGLIARETPYWREKRLQAENPNASAEELERLANDVFGFWSKGRYSKKQAHGHLLATTIAAHPNTKPDTLLFLLQEESPLYVGAFCRNPNARFLRLALSDFVDPLDYTERETCWLLLREGTLSSQLAGQLAEHKADYIAEEARLHISLAGELKTQTEGLVALNKFWRVFCINQSHDRNWWYGTGSVHAELAELGFAPTWAVGDSKDSMPPGEPPMSDVAQKWYGCKNIRVASRKFNRKDIPTARKLAITDKRRWGRLWRTVIYPVKPAQFNVRNARLLGPVAPARDLMKLARMTEAGGDLIREIIISHPNVTADVLRYLCRKSTRSTRLHLAVHPLTPPDILYGLAGNLDIRPKPRGYGYVNTLSFSYVRRLACHHKSALPETLDCARRTVLEGIAQDKVYITPFARFVANLQTTPDLHVLLRTGCAWNWHARLNSALKLPLSAEPFSEDPWNRSPLQLMKHLAHDGNRFVRWAAQTRLANPDFVFTWHDE